MAGESRIDSRGIFDLFAAQREAMLAAAVVSLGLAGGAQAQPPAVSAVNGKIEALGGMLDDEGAGLAAASVAVPLGPSFGGQLDVFGGSRDGDTLKGFGGHAFWRDPGRGLAGIVGQRVGVGSAWANRVGAEGEYYLPRLTVAGTLGWQGGDIADSFFAGLDLRYYAGNDVMLELGGAGDSDERLGHVGVEWRPGLGVAPGLALFADGALGSGDYQHALAGVRIYFGGGSKSLKRRHREDDPLNPLVGFAARFASRVDEATKSGGRTWNLGFGG